MNFRLESDQLKINTDIGWRNVNIGPTRAWYFDRFNAHEIDREIAMKMKEKLQKVIQ